MAFLSFLRSSRTGAAAVLLGSVGFIATAGAFGACGKEAPAADSTADADTTTIARTPSWGYEVVATHPHDTSSFTEGLFFHEGRLFESTGEVGTSYIREVELTTGRAIRQRDLAPPYFGEGTIVFGDKLYQLTWTSGKAFVYDWETFKPTGEFTYDGEGWALTTDGTSLIMSNGTPMIRWRDPKTFAVTDSISVTDHGAAVTSLNELEWVKGEIWANVWQRSRLSPIRVR
mgnify:FL=1